MVRFELLNAVKYTDDPKKMEELEELGYTRTDAEAVSDEGQQETAESATDEPNVAGLNALTVDKLQDLLTKAKVKFPAKAKKDILISIAEANGVQA